MVNARVFRLIAAGEIDEVATVGQKTRPPVSFESECGFIKLRDRYRLTTRRRHAEKRGRNSSQRSSHRRDFQAPPPRLGPSSQIV